METEMNQLTLLRKPRSSNCATGGTERKVTEELLPLWKRRTELQIFLADFSYFHQVFLQAQFKWRVAMHR